MKFKLFLVLIAIGLLSMAGCSNRDQTVDSEQNRDSEMTTEVATDYYKSGEIKFSDFEQVGYNEILSESAARELEKIAKMQFDYGLDESISEITSRTFKFYKRGAFSSGKYAGQELVYVPISFDGPSLYDTVYRAAYKPDTKELTLLTTVSSKPQGDSYISILFAKTDNGYTPKGLLPPSELTIKEATTPLVVDQYNWDYRFLGSSKPNSKEYKETLKAIIADSDYIQTEYGKLYQDDTAGCMYLVANDETIIRYEFDLGIIDTDKYDNRTLKAPQSVSGLNVSRDYNYIATGCGVEGNCYGLVNDKGLNTLIIGQSPNGTTFFRLDATKVQDKSLDNLESYDSDQINEILNSLDTTEASDLAKWSYILLPTETKAKLTFAQFLAQDGIIFFEDPLGRMSSLVSNDYAPAVECGKPVIYLYPEQKTKVNVQVDIKEFTKTEPLYNEDYGWNVIAEPNGKLTNLADNKTYPYLFWEGYTNSEITLDRGFLVKKADLSIFLNRSLRELGLNAVERRDFREFWLPAMLEHNKPYYKVQFVGTEAFNKVAPLAVSPKPDTTIRVFMYFEPLNEPTIIAPQDLGRAPEREGFTLVEWGGSSSLPFAK
jgi:hypothetical protein